MTVVIIKNFVNKVDLGEARKDYENYLKITIDIEKEILALGGEFHADAEKILLEQGSQQKDIWGGGLNLETKNFETNAIVNFRAGKNDSAEILDPAIRKKFLTIAQRFLKEYA